MYKDTKYPEYILSSVTRLKIYKQIFSWSVINILVRGKNVGKKKKFCSKGKHFARK